MIFRTLIYTVMKHILLIILTFIHYSIYSQKVSVDKIPLSVLISLKVKFPSAINIHWFYDTKTATYEAFFNISYVPHICEFNSNGEWTIAAIDVEVDNLPAVVLDAVLTNYSDYEIVESQMLQFSKSSEIVYLIDIEKNKEEYILRISDSGEILEKKVIGED